MAVRMELSRILIREMMDMQIIELSEVGGVRKFPIVIGLPEACAIERRLKGVETPRPQTHDLLASTIKQLGGRLKQISIHNLEHGTFFAKLVITRNGSEIEVDSRPSDAIALGVAEDVPIFVAEHVLEQTDTELSSMLDGEETEGDEDEIDEEDDEEREPM
jgi:hypothetical protein